MLISYVMMLFSSKLIKTEMGLFLVFDYSMIFFRLVYKLTASSKETGIKWSIVLF